MAENLLVCVDLKPLSHRVVKKAIELGKKLDSSITLMHIRDKSPTGSHSSATHSSQTAKDLILENNEMEKLEEQLRDSGLKFEVKQPMGDIVKLVDAVIKELNPLFLILGSSHNSALHHMISGSIAGSLLEKSGIPVLLVPGK